MGSGHADSLRLLDSFLQASSSRLHRSIHWSTLPVVSKRLLPQDLFSFLWLRLVHQSGHLIPYSSVHPDCLDFLFWIYTASQVSWIHRFICIAQGTTRLYATKPANEHQSELQARDNWHSSTSDVYFGPVERIRNIVTRHWISWWSLRS